MAPAKKRTVSDDHKAAMAQGRSQSRAIAAYLGALESHKPKRGRKRTAESVENRLAAIEQDLAAATGIKRLSLIQERLDLQAEKANSEGAVDPTAFEEDFVGAAREYGQRKGISYAAWRELGVPPTVLKRAGITRGG